MHAPKGELVRSIGLFALVVYGVGDMVGAGIYGTIGVAAGKLGNAVWLAFVVSMIAALLTGLSYASLASRYPKAGGAAYITERAYQWKFLSYVVGLVVACSGLTSMAAASRVFATTLQPLLGLPPDWLIVLLFIAFLTVINFRGIKECLWLNTLCTAIEIGGLLFVIAISVPYLGNVNYLETPPSAGGLTFSLVMSGAVLTFFAFVGFEDMLNVAEEVKNPRQTMPWGIIMAVVIATVIYVMVSLAVVSVVAYAKLADPAQGAPLAQLTRIAAPWLPHHTYTAITLFAVGNTALLNFIMGSRLIYGMARQQLLPGALGVVHPTRHTPHRAILALAILVTVLAFSGEVADLASATSLLLLLVFALMNVALIVLKLRKDEEKGGLEIPFIVPVLGFLVCAGLIVSRLVGSAGMRAPLIAALLIVAISVLYFLIPRQVQETGR